MEKKSSEHYSYNFKFDIEKLPAIQKDRLPLKLSISGIILGSSLILLGLLDVIVFMYFPIASEYQFDLPYQYPIHDLMVQRFTFDAIVVLLGICAVSVAVLAMRKYKEIFFDGEKIRILHQPMCGAQKVTTEDLYNYSGVLLKIEFYQLGLISRNRYIIELHHSDKSKTVPLYISTSSKDVRKMWEYYAEKLKMPALFRSDMGIISRNYKEFNTTLQEMSKKWKLKKFYAEDNYIPDSLAKTQRNNKLIVKIKRLFFDVYSMLSLLGSAFLLWLSYEGMKNYTVVTEYINGYLWILVIAVLVVSAIFFLMSVISKDMLVISENSVILWHNIGWVGVKSKFLDKDKISSVDVGYNPTTERYYLAVASQENGLIFGKNLPLEDLRWLRGYIIREIIK